MVEKKIYSILDGQIIPIEQVADPVFAEKMLGDGVAIRPALGKHTVVAPCDGVIQTLNSSNHALALLVEGGYELLIHIGVDTVMLKGEGFTPHIKVGDSVKKGDKLIDVDFDLIVNKVPSIDVMLLATNLSDDLCLIKSSKEIVKSGEDIFVIASKGASVKVSSDVVDNSGEGEEVVSPLCRVINLTGVHARPASYIFQIANKYKSKIELKKGDKTINAKSVVAILGLGIKYEEEVQIIAKGADAAEAVAEIMKAIFDGLGEGNAHVVAKSEDSATVSTKNENIITDFSKEITLNGVVASPNLVIGKSFVIQEEVIDVVEDSTDTDSELAVLDDSLYVVSEKLKKDIFEAAEKKQKTKVEIFEAHVTILGDESLLQDAKDLISKGKTAGFAWKMAIKNAIDVLHSTKNQLLIERVADFKDIERRVVKAILGMEDSSSLSFKENTIIVATDLVPSDIAKFDENIIGVILGLGSSTSHVSLMLRNMGTPAIVALGQSIINMGNDVDLIIDGNEGYVIINPESKKLKEIKEKEIKLNIIKEENISNCKKLATTSDGVKISVKGNVSNGREAYRAFDLGAEGVGLLRTEFLFFNSQTAPSEETQHVLYQEAVDSMQGGSVTLRTLDVGGDKPLSYVEIGHEENPIMGLRGVRNYAGNKEVFLTQIRAILKTKPLMLTKIMIPMVSDISEMIEVKAMIEEEKNKLGIKDRIEIGTMIEVPSAALMADKLAKHVDFFSIGTNDLAQYTLAMDRGNPKLTARLNNLHPALLRLIKLTVDSGDAANIPTAVCGAMASEIRSIPILIGLGVKELSTSMKAIPDVKALIRTLSYEKCKLVADKALNMDCVEDIVDLVKSEFNF